MWHAIQLATGCQQNVCSLHDHTQRNSMQEEAWVKRRGRCTANVMGNVHVRTAKAVLEPTKVLRHSRASASKRAGAASAEAGWGGRGQARGSAPAVIARAYGKNYSLNQGSGGSVIRSLLPQENRQGPRFWWPRGNTKSGKADWPAPAASCCRHWQGVAGGCAGPTVTVKKRQRLRACGSGCTGLRPHVGTVSAAPGAAFPVNHRPSGGHSLESHHQAPAEGAVRRLLVLSRQVARALQAQLVLARGKGHLHLRREAAVGGRTRR